MHKDSHRQSQYPVGDDGAAEGRGCSGRIIVYPSDTLRLSTSSVAGLKFCGAYDVIFNAFSTWMMPMLRYARSET